MLDGLLKRIDLLANSKLNRLITLFKGNILIIVSLGTKIEPKAQNFILSRAEVVCVIHESN